MTTTILILCFSMAVILLLTALLIRFSQDSEKREQRLLTHSETLTDALESVIRIQGVTSQKGSSDTVTLVTEAVKSINQTTTDLFLGREQDRLLSQVPTNEEPEQPPIPGIETFEGLPSFMVETLQREAQEHQRLTAPEWTVRYTPQPNGSEPSLPDQWILDSDQVQ